MAQALQPVMRFDPGFIELYNEYHSTERGRALLKLFGVSREQLDIPTMAMKYFEAHTGDMSVDPNANVGNSKCPNNFAAEIAKGGSKMTGYYLLWTHLSEEYGSEKASEIIAKCWRGHYYFHDLSGAGVTAPYCFAASTMPLIIHGRPYGQLRSKPPKRADSFMSQAVEYTMDLSQEFMGAIALGDLIVNFAMMCLKDSIDLDNDDGVAFAMNQFQKFVHVVNNKFRVSAQSPFTNISLFDRPQLKGLFKDYTYPDGAEAIDNIEYIMRAQELFMQFMAEKDPLSGMPYRFPITTVNITTEGGKILDRDFLKLVSKYNQEGLFNIYITEGIGKVASCCRLLSDVKQMRERQRSDVFGNGGLNIGSTRVCTINLARLGLEAGGPVEFRSMLRRAVKDVKDLLLAHRRTIEAFAHSGYLKFFRPLDWISTRMFFSTIGVVGLYEALEQFGEDYRLPSKKGIKEGQRILKYIDDAAAKFTEETGVPFNVEQIPAEGAAVTLAKADKIFFPKSPYKLYSNQSIPLWVDVDLITRARVDGQLNHCYSGGGISHLNIGSAVTAGQMEKLIEFAISCGLDHFALNPVFCRCEDGHISLGNRDSCPICGAGIEEKVTRVVGYYTPVPDWASVRREWEFPKRVFSDLVLPEEFKVEAPVERKVECPAD